MARISTYGPWESFKKWSNNSSSWSLHRKRLHQMRGEEFDLLRNTLIMPQSNELKLLEMRRKDWVQRISQEQSRQQKITFPLLMSYEEMKSQGRARSPQSRRLRRETKHLWNHLSSLKQMIFLSLPINMMKRQRPQIWRREVFLESANTLRKSKIYLVCSKRDKRHLPDLTPTGIESLNKERHLPWN